MQWLLKPSLLHALSNTQQKQQQQQQVYIETLPATAGDSSAGASSNGSEQAPAQLYQALSTTQSQQEATVLCEQGRFDVPASQQPFPTDVISANRQLSSGSIQHNQRRQSCCSSGRNRTAWCLMIMAVMLGLAAPITAQQIAADLQGTCPVSIDYAVSLGEGGGDNSNVPIFVASLGITNRANVSGLCFVFLQSTYSELGTPQSKQHMHGIATLMLLTALLWLFSITCSQDVSSCRPHKYCMSTPHGCCLCYACRHPLPYNCTECMNFRQTHS